MTSSSFSAMYFLKITLSINTDLNDNPIYINLSANFIKRNFTTVINFRRANTEIKLISQVNEILF